MNSKNLYIASGALAVLGIGAFAVLTLNEQDSAPAGAASEPKALESVERREEHAEQVSGKPRSPKHKVAAPGAMAAATTGTGEDVLVSTDVGSIDTSLWVQSMYDAAYVYQGPILTKAEIEAREEKRIGVHTEDSLRKEEDNMAEAMPHMQKEIEAARKEREAEQKRFAKVGESAEQKAARDGVQLEH